LFVLASGQSALNVVWMRCLIGGLVLLAWLGVQGGWHPMGRAAMAWLLLGAAALIVNWQLLFMSYRASGIAVATVVYHVQPFFLILLASLALRERTDWHKFPWLLVALLGVALTSGLTWDGAGEAGMLQGVLLALAAAFFYAVATLATRKLSAIASAQIAGVQLLIGALVLLPWVDISLSSLSPQAWACLLTLGLVHTGLQYNLLYAAFQRLTAERIAMLSFIYPLVAIVVDLVFFDLALDVVQVAGMLLIFMAIVAHQRNWRFSLMPVRSLAQ
jgi:drug/metabolite transporter (DMT)-like permease